MPKDTREIARAIRMPGKRVTVNVAGKGEREVFEKGQVLTDPDDVVTTFKPSEIKALQQSGVIIGDWKPSKK